MPYNWIFPQGPTFAKVCGKVSFAKKKKNQSPKIH